ncbi:MAG: 3-hydroxyacyl-ACP dehydratase FabZ [Kiritimatiellae bacterium]|nr:3-hydroxyacyl-ACP dehydratase FabZ [Kiritimatiellia bacterium]
MAVMDINEILQILPHRYPMLLVDRVIECDFKARIVAIKNLSINEPFFQGHFPGDPVMPGVLQVEAMAQTAGVLINKTLGGSGRISYFTGIERARFRRIVKPGDQLRFEVEILKIRLGTAKVHGRALVGDELASEADMTFRMKDA